MSKTVGGVGLLGRGAGALRPSIVPLEGEDASRQLLLSYSDWRNKMQMDGEEPALSGIRSYQSGGDVASVSARLERALLLAPRTSRRFIGYTAFAVGANGIPEVGSRITNKGYTSLALSRGDVTKLANGRRFPVVYGRVVVPAGTKGIYTDAVTGREDGEFLLPQGARLVVLGSEIVNRNPQLILGIEKGRKK